MKRFGLALFLCLAALSAAAEDAPDKQLKQTDAALKEAAAREKALSGETGALESQLEAMQQRLVDMASRVQSNEQKLSDEEERLATVSAELERKQASMDAKSAEIKAMLDASVRLSALPPESVLAMPGEMEESMTAARALTHLSRSLKKESTKLKEEVSALKELKMKVAQSRDAVHRQQQALESEQEKLDEALVERRVRLANLTIEQKEIKNRVQKLSREAKTLKDLLAKLEKDKAKEKPEVQKERAKKTGKLRSFTRAKGHIEPPAAGKTVMRFNQAMNENETSKGIKIRTRGGARIVAPYDAEVAYSGTFLNFGPMVILQHSDNYYSLLAGLGKIDVTEGDFLLEGEPIGAMQSGDAAPELYIELRKNNQPIDPVPWIPALKN